MIAEVVPGARFQRGSGARFIAESGRTVFEGWEPLAVELEGGDLIVTHPRSRFRAVYYKPVGQRELILRVRTKTDDYELLTEAWKAANAKARELGWIV